MLRPKIRFGFKLELVKQIVGYGFRWQTKQLALGLDWSDDILLQVQYRIELVKWNVYLDLEDKV